MSAVADWFLSAIAAGTIESCVVPVQARGIAVVVDGNELTRFDFTYMPRVRKFETTVILGVMSIACDSAADADLLQDKLEDCMMWAYRKYFPSATRSCNCGNRWRIPRGRRSIKD